eukprot:1163256-Alexandrium_andersonii.AAC.1
MASTSAYSWANALRSGNAAVCCCRTARVPRLSERPGAGVLRWKYRRHTSEAHQDGQSLPKRVEFGSPRDAPKRERSKACRQPKQ